MTENLKYAFWIRLTYWTKRLHMEVPTGKLGFKNVCIYSAYNTWRYNLRPPSRCFNSEEFLFDFFVKNTDKVALAFVELLTTWKTITFFTVDKPFFRKSIQASAPFFVVLTTFKQFYHRFRNGFKGPCIERCNVSSFFQWKIMQQYAKVC